jgi:porin
MSNFLAPRPVGGNRFNHQGLQRGCSRLGLSLAAIAFPAVASAADGALTLDTSLIVDGMVSVSEDDDESGVAAHVDLKLLLDGAPLGVPGLTGMAGVTVYSGDGISGSLGDLQGVSNIAATRMVRPVNAWLQYGSGRFAIKAGVMDTNADFDEQNVGAAFLGSSHGTGPDLSSSGLNGSGAVPNTALGVTGFLTDEASGLKLRAGVFTGRPGDPDHPRRLSWKFGDGTGAFSIAELDWTGASHRIAFGAWHHSARLPRIDGTGDHRGSTGGFAIVEGTLAGKPADAETGKARGARLDGWMRLGIADRATAPVTRYVGGGLVTTGFWDRHPEDTLGVAVAHAVANDTAGPDVGPETSIELTYQHALGSGLTIQPDVQWLLNPGADRTRANAVVFGLRLIAVH